MNSKSNMKPSEIVDKMMENDAFSKWLGIQIIDVEEGYAKLKLTIRPEMLNGFGIAHGGIAYSLADSALAFAGNAVGRISVSTQNSISYFTEVKPGDELTATATQVNEGKKIAYYKIDIVNQNNKSVASFNGTIYRTSKFWLHN